jgi:hypothetical protein
MHRKAHSKVYEGGALMADIHYKSCDVCKRSLPVDDSWLVALTREKFEGILFQPLASVEQPNPDFHYHDICGQHCAQRAFSQWLGDFMERIS